MCRKCSKIQRVLGIIFLLLSYYDRKQALNGGKAIDILNKIRNYREEEDRSVSDGSAAKVL